MTVEGTKQLVILGGGTAGWLTAAYLSRRLSEGCPENQPYLQITLVEASDIAPVGVGEATVPSIRVTLARMGVDEYAFMRACDAGFKHGIKFSQWCREADQNPVEAFYHPFQRPLKVGTRGMAHYWLQGLDPHNRAFCDAVSVQPRLADLELAPKTFSDPPYQGIFPYAYHLDAGRLAEFLKGLAIQSGVVHRVDKVTGVRMTNEQQIASLELDSGQTLRADAFIDCSGFQGRLIEGQLGAKLHPVSDWLFCDRALACQVPHRGQQPAIRPYTLSQAQKAGWIWDIGLSTRRGTGYVYSSTHSSEASAEAEFRAYLGEEGANAELRSLQLRSGYRHEQWLGNCVAIGLSAGFLEPLESTGIHFIELALYALETFLPRFLSGGQPQPRFNRLMQDQYEISIEFIKLHYFLSGRRDSAFWRDNTDPKSSPAELLNKLEAWENGYPDIQDLNTVHSVFDHMGYQYIYLGMQAKSSQALRLTPGDHALARRAFNATWEALPKAQQALPSHKSLLDSIHTKENKFL